MHIRNCNKNKELKVLTISKSFDKDIKSESVLKLIKTTFANDINKLVFIISLSNVHTQYPYEAIHYFNIIVSQT